MIAAHLLRRAIAVVAVGVVSGVGAGAASAATTPGWECVPTTAGQRVLSGGTGSAPSCGAGTTPVLAPTYVAISGGSDGSASELDASVVGGDNERATGNLSSVLGGSINTASAYGSSVLGASFDNASSLCLSIPASPGAGC